MQRVALEEVGLGREARVENLLGYGYSGRFVGFMHKKIQVGGWAMAASHVIKQ